jgi:hypothetical protein
MSCALKDEWEGNKGPVLLLIPSSQPLIYFLDAVLQRKTFASIIETVVFWGAKLLPRLIKHI